MLKKIITIALLSTSFGSLQAAQLCTDDARLYTIKTVIKDIEAGKDIAPIKLTGATFLAMTTPVRKALGDNITVQDENCVPYQVYNGAPAKKVLMPYEQLSVELEKAAMRKDEQAFNMVLDFFEAKPKGTRELISLIAPLAWSKSAAEWAQTQGLLTHRKQLAITEYPKKYPECPKLDALNTNIELYQKLGGRISPDGVIVSNHADRNRHFLTATDGTFYATSTFLIDIPSSEVSCTNIRPTVAMGALANTGVTVITNPINGNNNVSRERDQSKWLMEKLPAKKCNDDTCAN